jgi:hypothetical protein
MILDSSLSDENHLETRFCGVEDGTTQVAKKDLKLDEGIEGPQVGRNKCRPKIEGVCAPGDGAMPRKTRESCIRPVKSRLDRVCRRF